MINSTILDWTRKFAYQSRNLGNANRVSLKSDEEALFRNKKKSHPKQLYKNKYYEEKGDKKRDQKNKQFQGYNKNKNNIKCYKCRKRVY